MNTLITSDEDDRHEFSAEPGGPFLGVMCWVPLVAFLLLMAFTTIAFLRVGHWPYYSHPDPKNLGLPLLHVAALLSYPLAFFGVSTCLFAVIARWRHLRWRHIVVSLIGMSAWAFIFPITGRLLDWLVD